jgi:hypothetical protein
MPSQLSFIEREPDDFVLESGEQFIHVIVGKKGDFSSLSEFWELALPYVRATTPAKLSDLTAKSETALNENQYFERVCDFNKSGNVKSPIVFDFGDFLKGYVMQDEACEFLVLGEFSRNYVSFMWYTTA